MSAHPSDDACCPTSSPTPAGPTTAQRSQVPPPAVDAAKLRELLAHAAKTTPPSAPTPVMKFGQYVRQVVDATPESTAGVLAMGKFLRLDPVRKEIDQLKDQLVVRKIESDANKDEIRRLQTGKSAAERRRGQLRRKNQHGRRGAKNDVDGWLERLERDVASDVKKDGYQPNEFYEEMIARVYGLESEDLADEINRRYGKGTTSGSSIRRREKATVITNSEGKKEKVLGAYRSNRYTDWERYRRGEAPGSRLAAGSTKLLIREASDEAPQESEEPTRLCPSGAVSTAAANRKADCGRDGDDRQRNLMDDTLMTATVQEAAELEIVAGNLVMHEGGTGLLHLRSPETEAEHQEDLQTRAADEFLRTKGIDPHAAPWRPAR